MVAGGVIMAHMLDGRDRIQREMTNHAMRNHGPSRTRELKTVSEIAPRPSILGPRLSPCLVLASAIFRESMEEQTLGLFVEMV